MEYSFNYDIDGKEIEIQVDDDEVIDALFEVLKDSDGKVKGLDEKAFVKALNAFFDLGLIDLDEVFEWYKDDLKDEFYERAKEEKRNRAEWEEHYRRLRYAV